MYPIFKKNSCPVNKPKIIGKDCFNLNDLKSINVIKNSMTKAISAI
jgi:hypothetical protein